MIRSNGYASWKGIPFARAVDASDESMSSMSAHLLDLMDERWNHHSTIVSATKSALGR